MIIRRLSVLALALALCDLALCALAACDQPSRCPRPPEPAARPPVSDVQRSQLCSAMWRTLDADGQTNETVAGVLLLTPRLPEMRIGMVP